MKPNLNSISHLFFIMAIMLIIGLFIFLSIISFPASQDNTASYPGPVGIVATPTLISPESLCDQWFSYRKGLSVEKRAIAEEEYKNCVNARETPSPVGITKAIPSAPPGGINKISLVSRPAGKGTILETSFSPLNSIYRIINQWRGDIDGMQIVVYAGGRRSDAESGDVNERSWPGIVVLVVKDSNGNYIDDKGGEFWTPQNVGPVRIVDAISNQLTLVAQNGTSFLFDVTTRQFITEKLTSLISRPMGAGMLVESGYAPYSLADFDFVNYWYFDNKDSSRVVVMAGGEVENPKSGTLIIAVSSPSNKSELIKAMAFHTNMSDGNLRIVNADGEKLTLISADDLVYEFDVSSMQFASLPSGSSAISGMPIKVEILSTQSHPMFSSSTPGVTKTPGPSRTLLPTYNP
jgi:hypothetical protein